MIIDFLKEDILYIMNTFGIFQKQDILKEISPVTFIISGKTANKKELQDLKFNQEYELLFYNYDEITVRRNGKILNVYKGEKLGFDCI